MNNVPRIIKPKHGNENDFIGDSSHGSLKVAQIVIALLLLLFETFVLCGSLGLTVVEKPTFWGFGEPDDTPVFTDDGWRQRGMETRILN